ncbi:myelin regulatory factor-like protein isoform X1 [Melanaphis sacchari]|nr:myelin regulatory factor-like protein isoform X1 [Melanaphis sacchari]XP_025191684.1 myelin regulatory factor-like protein isoform X1 [Melanaphis sacchari]XP_025191685.1 myelin regulatory factor-like protein isoform X1 [Melanaphis sacchari]
MEYTWTLVSNTDDQGLGSETSLLNCNVQGPHSGQILILSNESSTQAIQNQTLPDITSPLEKDYGASRLHSNEPRKLHLMHNRSDFVGGIDNEALDFSHLTDEFIQNNNTEANQFFHETVDQNDHVMVRINTPYQQESPQLFLKNASIPPIADLSFHSNSVLSNAGLPSKPIKDKSHNYTNRHNLPESPPDSEPPYSPADGVGQSPHRRTPNLQCLISANKGQIPMNSGTTGLYQKQPGTAKIPHPLSVQPLMINQPGSSSHVTHLDFNQMPSNARAIDIPEPEYTDLLNVTVSEKKRKLCTEIIGGNTGGNSVRVKKETENCGKKPITHVSPSGRSVCSEDSYTYQDSCESGLYNDTSFQCIRFQPFQESSWNTLCDHSLKELPVPHYRVDADKGFNFSNVDDAFVCQKKNHFQITCHTQLQGDAQFVRTTEGIHKVGSFHLHFYGVKVESPSQTIKVEQSQSDRSKKAFHPVLLDLREEQVSKVTVGRLHFSETTCNNMRKKGKPNPDQRYFYLVVGLHAHCINDHDYPIVSYASERIIVRVIQASNPGQFESDAELCWQRGTTPESIVHAGKVGINTDRPDEALVVHGNVKLTGHIIQPSDIRIKQHIQKCDTSEQLRNVQKINVVHFSYKPEFSSLFGLSLKEADTGIIAQEVQAVLPEAVTNAGGIALPNGIVYDDFLVVNKDRIFMENVGAVKELSKITSHLEARISELEQDHKRCLLLEKYHPGIALSDLSTTTYSSKHNDCDGTVEKRKLLKPTSSSDVYYGKFVQISIISLTVVIACCLIFITGLFFMEHHYRNQITFTSEHELIVKPFNINAIRAHESVQPKDTGQLPLEIDGFLDKDKHLTCMRLRRLVANSRSCEYGKIKAKMNKNIERKKEEGKNTDEFISFIIKIDRVVDIVYKDVTIGVYGSYSNFTAETNITDECGQSELLQQCSDKSLFVYGFQLPVTKQLTDYFISVSYRISKGSLNGCLTSMSVSTTCPSDPYTNLWAANGTRWNSSDTSYEWQTNKYSVSEDSESIIIIVRYKPWPYERLKASCRSPEDKQTLAIVEYTVSLHKDFSEIV